MFVEKCIYILIFIYIKVVVNIFVSIDSWDKSGKCIRTIEHIRIRVGSTIGVIG